MRSAASSSRTEEEATAEEATAEETCLAFAKRALTSAGTDAGAAAPQARSIPHLVVVLALSLRFVQQVADLLWIGFSSCTACRCSLGPGAILALLRSGTLQQHHFHILNPF